MSSVTRDIAFDCSPFLARLIERHPEWWSGLQGSGRLQADSPPAAAALAAELEQHGLHPGLRRFRNGEMLRIVWRELNSVATLSQTMSDLSRLAELCLQAAVNAHSRELGERYGTPRNAAGDAMSLVVLGLGKLGGRELNLSSDIDIVFCYPERGQTDGPRRLANEQYFQRLARAVVNSLSDVTPDGFCFRVDTRLRPFGDSGPLVCSFGAMEQYYQREGRDWERYSLIKARPVAGDQHAGGVLLGVLKPFVYRRYIDFGAVESMREMLASVREDAARKGREDDIKRGQGGIRDIEFLVQCLQLLRGGREPELQTPSLLTALDQLQALGVMEAANADSLRRAYAFLRRTENAIQALHDQQTHLLPAGEDRRRVVTAMGFKENADFDSAMARTRAEVTSQLAKCFPEPGPEQAPAGSWTALLDDRGVAPDSPLGQFRSRVGRMALSRRGAARLAHFMPMLLERMWERETPEPVQADVVALVSGICRRSAYLALLVENPGALDRMLDLFSRSDWVAQAVIRHPALLDELIDPALGSLLPGRQEMDQNVLRVLKVHDDPEEALQTLNYMKLSFSLRLAVAELAGSLDGEQAQTHLTGLAEALLGACLELATKLMQQRSTTVPDGSGLALVAYGSLGAREMSYGSDLDLIFLFRKGATGSQALASEQYFTRLARRMLGLATTLTPAGRLYEIDTRLRPNGRAGLLVSSLSAFERYQSQDAWIWELQALTRARAVAGDAEVAGRFGAIRFEVLTQARNPGVVRTEVRDMRQRMRMEFGEADPLKHGPGCLVDIGFVAQMGVLECARACPALLDHTGTREQLETLARHGWLDPPAADQLIATHVALTRARHHRALSRQAPASLPDTTASWEICRGFLE